jgi:AcrR family transcriptional regulator
MSRQDNQPEPRCYDMSQRQAAVDQTRARIVEAARELIAADEGVTGFTMEAVARQAGVSRMTVYYQFKSKIGLLEALCDSLGARGGIAGLAGVFDQPDPLVALDQFVELFVRFMLGSDRQLIRRLHAFAGLDPDFDRVLQTRTGWRREGIRSILQRIAQQSGRPEAADLEKGVTIICALTGYETLQALAGLDRGFEEVAPLAVRLARLALDFKGK